MLGGGSDRHDRERRESIVLNLESHQDPTEWERENFSRQKLTCTCGRKEVGYRVGCGLGLVKRDPDTTRRASGTVAGSRLALALPARGLAKENWSKRVADGERVRVQKTLRFQKAYRGKTAT